MKVAYGATILARGLSGEGIDGIGHYTKELHDELIQIPSVELNNYSFGIPINSNILGRPTHLLGRFSYELARGAVLPWLRMTSQIGVSQVDLIHATDHLVPIVKGVPLVSTIMDAIPLSNPEWINHTVLGRAKTKLWKMMVKRSDHVLTISEYSKSEITRYFGIEPSRISVVPLGVDQRFFYPIPELERKSVLTRYNIDKPYFISVGTLQPRKNIARILEVMSLLPEYIRKTYSLVIVGHYGKGSDSLVKAIHKAEREGWCKWLGYLPDDDLRSLLQSATLLVFPSLCEGFGLPILEAFASKVPVVASNTSSIPEVAGDAAILVDPLDSADIASAITKIIEDKEFTETLIQKGIVRAKEMTWRRCAEDTFNVYKTVIENYR